MFLRPVQQQLVVEAVERWVGMVSSRCSSVVGFSGVSLLLSAEGQQVVVEAVELWLGLVSAVGNLCWQPCRLVQCCSG